MTHRIKAYMNASSSTSKQSIKKKIKCSGGKINVPNVSTKTSLVLCLLIIVMSFQITLASSSNLERFNDVPYSLYISSNGEDLIPWISLLNWTLTTEFNLSSNDIILRPTSLNEDENGIFGTIKLEGLDNSNVISKNNLNLTNILFWTLKSQSEWRKFALAHSNESLPNHFASEFYPVQYDEVNGILRMVRFLLEGNITEVLEINTVYRITTKIAWHNTSLLPTIKTLSELLNVMTDATVILLFRGSSDLLMPSLGSSSGTPDNASEDQNSFIITVMLSGISIIVLGLIPLIYLAKQILPGIRNLRWG